MWISVQSLRSGRFSASRFSCAKQIYLTNVHPIFSYVVNTLSGFLVRKYTIFSSVIALQDPLRSNALRAEFQLENFVSILETSTRVRAGSKSGLQGAQFGVCWCTVSYRRSRIKLCSSSSSSSSSSFLSDEVIVYFQVDPVLSGQMSI